MSPTSAKSTHSLPPIAYIGMGILLLNGSLFLLKSLRGVGNLTAVQITDLVDRISFGERLLLVNETNPGKTSDKKLGIEAFAQGNYSLARTLFSTSLRKHPNDPESRIYLNNAITKNQEGFKIAVSVPIGSDVNGAKEILRGVAQAQDEYNQQADSSGKKLTIAIANDDNNPEIAQKLAQRFVEQGDILGVVGHYASNVTLATAPIYDKGKLPVISPISSSIRLSNLSKFVFRTIPSDYIAARVLASYMLSHVRRQKAVVYYNSTSDYSVSLKREFISAISLAGGQSVTEFDLAHSGFSANQSLINAQQQGAEVIMLAADSSTLNQGLQVVHANAGRLPILGGDDVYTPKTLDIAREQGQRMVVAIPWHSLSPSSRPFARRAQQMWKAEVNWRTVTAYDATRAFIAALPTQAKNSRLHVQTVLENPNFSPVGASNLIRFWPSGDRNISAQLVTIVPGDRSGFGYDFVPLQP